VIAALDFERASLEGSRAVTAVRCYQSGPGTLRAGECAAAALADGAVGLVSWGLAGALEPTLRAGDVVLPRRVLAASGEAYPTDADWRAALRAALAPDVAVVEGDLLTAASALLDRSSKAAAARSTGAAAVDMESAGIAAVAARAGARFVAVRVIVDTAHDALPDDAEAWLDERGNRRPHAALRAVLAPRRWPLLLQLARRYGAARRSLERVALRLAACAWCAPPPAAGR
jgi:nucleoside phosphorylase